jgi:hypothetical protein
MAVLRDYSSNGKEGQEKCGDFTNSLAVELVAPECKSQNKIGFV